MLSENDLIALSCNLFYLAHRELAPINYLALNLTQRVKLLTLEYAECSKLV